MFEFILTYEHKMPEIGKEKNFENFGGFLQPALLLNRYIDENKTKGAENVLNKVIKRIVRAAIESFPIDEGKKAELLQRIIKEREGERDVLQ